ncbi:cytochrome C oxidase subunit IV family protein [Luteolibacter pohnpeiensis]|uniref:Cytochrome C oxidase subunit IV family protein n=1 Tax=Luteolibacter pohnpeiensis TaxID=454153 RepID=A0A934S775_9BACT|nr:cytochrome C oxidase subunit IV family protein [Luteolibacter pohnpeiensis]MBK1882076.1 cytochrome C oxidase subunit IV family protein [Luteolibacter pohnpeiensis]
MKFSTLLSVYIGLVLLLALSLGMAFMPLHGSLKLVVGLAVAAAKATLIVWFFMHVRYQSGLIRVFAAAGGFWLLLMFVLTAVDYLTR